MQSGEIALEPTDVTSEDYTPATVADDRIDAIKRIRSVFGSRLSAARKLRGWSQSEVRDEVRRLFMKGVYFDQAHLSSMERTNEPSGKLPSVQVLYALSFVLGINPGYLLGLVDNDVSCEGLNNAIVIDESDISRRVLIQEAVRSMRSMDDDTLGFVFQAIQRLKK